jgi:hypothetical protein
MFNNLISPNFCEVKVADLMKSVKTQEMSIEQLSGNKHWKRHSAVNLNTEVRQKIGEILKKADHATGKINLH